MRFLALISASVALAIVLLLPNSAPSTTAEPQLFLEDAGPVILYDRVVCSLLNSDATVASIAGQDGGASIYIDGKSYFIFGDTAYLANPEKVTFSPNGVAVSTDTNASDCIAMAHKATNGIARPLLPQRPDETSLWPDGLLPAPDGDIWFYAGSVVPGPSPWWVQGVGLGRMDEATLDSTRVAFLLWDESNAFPTGWAIGIRGTAVVDGVAHLMIHSAGNAVYIARVPLAAVADIGAYEYWTGSGWSPSTADAGELWVQADGFNGAALRWSEARQEWMAIYNPDHGRHVRVRTAPALTGPWSREYEWIDCARFVAPWVLPMCYSAAFHPQFDRDGGRTMTITFSTWIPYQIVVHEIRLATPIYQWRNAANETRLQPESPGAGFVAEGIAFYASDVPVPGLSAVRRWIRPNGEQIYAFNHNEVGAQNMGTAFYASPKAKPNGANLTYDPVYKWEKDGESLYSPLEGRAELGYTRGPAMFYGVCGDADVDAASDCQELAQGTDPFMADSDGDGFGDRPANTANPNWIPSVDNCPALYNPGQSNIDGEPWINNDGVLDWTNPNADALGDACDSDRDNDGIPNEEEILTNPDDPDTDGDFWPDGVEVACGSDPLAAASVPTGPDSDRDRIPDACEIAIGSNPFSRDSDSDGIGDWVEVRWLSDPMKWDTDGDGLSDACEIGSVNADRQVTALDLMLIAQKFLTSGDATLTYDLNRDGRVMATDMVIAAANFGICP